MSDAKEREADTTEFTLTLITFLILSLFLGWMLYLLISTNFQTTNPESPVTSDARARTSVTCPRDECSTNIISGFKVCPEANKEIIINPSTDVCNPRFECNNPLTPFAVQSDGSTRLDGTCEDGVQCACARQSKCPDYVLSVFTVSNGNFFDPLPGQRISFPQKSVFIAGGGASGGAATDLPPIQFSDPGTTFCLAKLSILPLATPGCKFVSATSNDIFTYDDLVLCMGAQSGCDGINSNPCLQGVLAIVSNDPDSLSATDISTYQYGCVRGNPCACGEVAVYDTRFGGVVCKKLSFT